MEEHPLLVLMHLEVDALRRHVELQRAHQDRLDARVAGRTDEVVYWVASDDELEDDETLDALRLFPPTNWWEDD